MFSFFQPNKPIYMAVKGVVFDVTSGKSRFRFSLSDLTEIRESHLTAQSLRVLFQDISPEKFSTFLKEINIFGKK